MVFKGNSDIVVSLFSFSDFQTFIISFLNTLIGRTEVVLDFSDHLSFSLEGRQMSQVEFCLFYYRNFRKEILKLLQFSKGLKNSGAVIDAHIKKKS